MSALVLPILWLSTLSTYYTYTGLSTTLFAFASIVASVILIPGLFALSMSAISVPSLFTLSMSMFIIFMRGVCLFFLLYLYLKFVCFFCYIYFAYI